MNQNPVKRPGATMSELPVDVIVDIFSRLPVKTLLRFRCVSKQFLSIIDGEDFIKRHLQFHSLRQKIIIKGLEPKLSFLDLDSVDNAYELELPFDVEYWGRDYRIKVIGSCDGLLALSNSRVGSIGDIGLWNVSIKKHRILPRCMFHYDFDGVHTDGFGRYPGSNDYKLVRILNSHDTTKVFVYSSEANSWRLIDSVPPYSRYSLCGDGALVEGTLNWVGKFRLDEGRKKHFILSYDLKNEIFSEVLLPDSIKDDGGEPTLGLKDWGGRLCLLCGYPGSPVDIWLMKEYGLKNSWVKMYTFSEGLPLRWLRLRLRGLRLRSGRGFHHVSFYSNHGYHIISTTGPSRRVFCYDVENGKYKIKSGTLPTYVISVINYTDSLVWPHV